MCCVKILVEWAEILAALFFYAVSKKYNLAFAIFGNKKFRPTLLWSLLNHKLIFGLLWIEHLNSLPRLEKL